MKKWNRWLSALLVLCLLLTYLPAGTVRAAGAAQKPSEEILPMAGSSEVSIQEKIAQVQKCFPPNQGMTFTQDSEGAKQCFGFARTVFEQIFGRKMASQYYLARRYEYYEGNSYYHNIFLVGQLRGASAVTESGVRNLLSQARLGDVIQACGTHHHTMVVVGTDTGGVEVYDCNYYADSNGETRFSNSINQHYMSYAELAYVYSQRHESSESGMSLYRASCYDEMYGAGNSDYVFSDVPRHMYYYEPVQWAVRRGVTVGYPGGNFLPDELCTRGQIMTFLHRARYFTPRLAVVPDLKDMVLQGGSSSVSIQEKLAQIESRYPPNQGVKYRENYGGCTECFGFARMVFYNLFGCDMPSSYYLKKRYEYTNSNNVTLIGQLEGVSAITESSVRRLLSQAKMGDIIQACGKYHHTMVVVSTNDYGVEIYDANSQGDLVVRRYTKSYRELAQIYGRNHAESATGMSLYHADNYEELYGAEMLENPFADIRMDMYYSEPVLWAVKNQLALGFPEGTFQPDASCTRAQIATFLWRFCGEPEPRNTANPFQDVKPGDWFFKPVLWAAENGITVGFPGGKFLPNAGCTRGQIVTFLSRLFH